jgi:hypothetical protein
MSGHTIGMNDGFDPTKIESRTLRIFRDREAIAGTQGLRTPGERPPRRTSAREELELGFVFLGGEDEVRGEFVAAFGDEILNQG